MGQHHGLLKQETVQLRISTTVIIILTILQILLDHPQNPTNSPKLPLPQIPQNRHNIASILPNNIPTKILQLNKCPIHILHALIIVDTVSGYYEDWLFC